MAEFKKLHIFYILVLVFSLVLFWNIGSSAANKDKTIEYYTCPMHPQIKKEEPGKCPICSMELVPVYKEDKNDDEKNTISFSSDERKLSEIKVSPVEKKFVHKTLNMSATLEINQNNIFSITADFRGRIEELFINDPGVKIRKGEHLARLFSSKLSVVQRELLMSVREQEKEKNNDQVKLKDVYSLNSVKRKMKVWGITGQQIKDIISSNEISNTLLLYSSNSGTIIEVNVEEGEYFKKGNTLFKIADLSNLWLNINSYEIDLPFLRIGQKVNFSVEANPGKNYTGTIIYIEPFINKDTRTSEVRVIVDNSDQELKPGMFARAEMKIKMGESGAIPVRSKKKLWICPMHPEVVENSSGYCDICGMELIPLKRYYDKYGVKTSEKPKNNEPPTVIPISAPLITGERAIVYVQKAPGKYEAREILLGPKADNYYIVEKGLKPGEKVVTKGKFKLDSEMQISTKKSMMNKNTDKDQ